MAWRKNQYHHKAADSAELLGKACTTPGALCFPEFTVPALHRTMPSANHCSMLTRLALLTMHKAHSWLCVGAEEFPCLWAWESSGRLSNQEMQKPFTSSKELLALQHNTDTKYFIYTHTHSASTEVYLCPQRGREMESEQEWGLLYKIDFSVLGVGHLPVFWQRT